jgi:hypothetical protein
VSRYQDWVQLRYSELTVESAQEPIKLRAAEDAIAGELEALVQAGEMSVPPDYHQIVRTELAALDKADRNNQEDRLSFLRDCLDDATIMGVDDPSLDRVFVMGGGLRKAYRYITTDDLLARIEVKQIHATQAAASAQRFTGIARDISRRLRDQGVDTLGELF